MTEHKNSTIEDEKFNSFMERFREFCEQHPTINTKFPERCKNRKYQDE